MLGLGCSRSAAALVSRKWEQVVGAACSVVSGGVVTEVEANFAWLARQGTPTLASVGVSFSNELATLIKQTVSRFHCQFSTQTNLHFITAKKSNKIHPDCFFDPKIPGMMPSLPHGSALSCSVVQCFPLRKWLRATPTLPSFCFLVPLHRTSSILQTI